MTPSLLDRLRQELPADWQHGDASSEAWYADPIRTVYLTIGDRRLFVLSGEALGGAVLYLAGLMPGHNEEQRVTSLAIVCYATVALLSVATVGGVLILSLLEITP